MMSRRVRLRSSSARPACEDDGLPVGFEASAEVETLRCGVVGFVADLDSLCAGLGEQVDAGGEDVAGKTSSLVIVLGAQGFDETGGGLGVVPEQPVRCHALAAVLHHQVEVGAVQRSLTKTRLGVRVVPFGADHVVRTLHRVEAIGQPIALVQRADLWDIDHAPDAWERQTVRFVSGDTECAASHYPGTNGGCVIMAGGLAVTKGPGTDLFAKRFNAAGFTVLAFDHRHLGDSGGEPRQIVRIHEQLADWQAAIVFAATLPGVDPTRVAIWSFSVSGGHVLRVAARNPELAAAIAQTPNANGPAAARNATRHQTPIAMLRFTGRAVLDALGSAVGRPPLFVPLTGTPGTVAVLTTPDALDGGSALDPDSRYPDWRQAVAARSALRFAFYRPGRYASRVRCPLLVIACDQDQSALAGPAVRAAKRAPLGELVRMPGGHYAPFLDGHEQAAKTELSFLRRHLLDRS
jgi:pimeloyl-ACP methyl ester carboxylesterase